MITEFSCFALFSMVIAAWKIVKSWLSPEGVNKIRYFNFAQNFKYHSYKMRFDSNISNYRHVICANCCSSNILLWMLQIKRFAQELKSIHLL